MRTVRVVPDVAGIEGEFDYTVPEKFDARVSIGSIVRVNFHNRRVRAWVIDADSVPPPNKRLLPIEHVTGYGPNQELIDLASWAAWRYAGKRSFFLQTASPTRAIPNLALPSMVTSASVSGHDVTMLERIVRLPPSRSPLSEVMEAKGVTLLITPTQRSAEGWVRRLRTEGKRVAHHPDDWRMEAEGSAEYVVGTRAAVWAPMPILDNVIVVDSHDDGLQSEASPTWNAVDIAAERARRRSANLTLVSAVPRVEQLAGRELITLSREQERHGWAPLTVIDRRGSDPRSGLYSEEVVKLLRSDKRVVCVLNRKGRAQLLVCNACDEMARCPNCDGAQTQTDDMLVCSRCKLDQPVVCRHCGSAKFKQLRVGTARVREDLESLALRPVGEVTGDTDAMPGTEVTVGTAAVLYRLQHVDAVIFLDFDQELLMPRYRANEDALILLARAARLVGGRGHKGLVMVQTRQPQHEVIDAAVNGDAGRFTKIETQRRIELNWPPNSALSKISGTGAPEYVKQLTNVEVLDLDGKTFLLQAADHVGLCDALKRVGRPSKGTLRVEVDPPRV